jgi:hypothetical protein
MGPIGCPQTSVRNYHYTLPNRPEQRSSRHGLKTTFQLFRLLLLLKHDNTICEQSKRLLNLHVLNLVLVGTATRLWDSGSKVRNRQGAELFSKVSTPALGRNQPLVQFVLASFRGIERPGREVDR